MISFLSAFWLWLALLLTPAAVPTVAPTIAPARPAVVKTVSAAPVRPVAPSCRMIAVNGTVYPSPTTGQGIPAYGLWLDGEAGANNLYVIGHNPGAGSVVLGIYPGQMLCFRGQRFRAASRQAVQALTGGGYLTTGYSVPTLTLQTCLTEPKPSGWLVLVVIAVPA